VLLKGVIVLGFQMRDFARHRQDDLRRDEEELMGLFAAGTVGPHVDAVFRLEQTAAALRHVADGRAVGKVVLDVVPGAPPA
jgi:NADPH:quinone reductase